MCHHKMAHLALEQRNLFLSLNLQEVLLVCYKSMLEESAAEL